MPLLLAALLLAGCGSGGGGDAGGGGGGAMAWTKPADAADNISPGGEHVTVSYEQKRVVMDDLGNALVMWLQRNGTKDRFYLSEYRDGTWSHPTDLTDSLGVDPTQNSNQPGAAMDNNGNAVLAWTEYDAVGGAFRLMKSEFRGKTWMHPLDFTAALDAGGESANYATVAMDDNGDALIAWHSRTGIATCGTGSSPCEAYYLSEYRGSGWSKPASLADHISPGNHRASAPPDVAMGNNGDALIVWEQENSFYYTYLSEYRAPGPWAHPADDTAFISPTLASVSFPQVAMADNGEAAVVWAQSDGSNTQIFLSEYRSSAWTHPSSLTDNISPDGSNTDIIPKVAMNAAGDAVVVWPQRDAGGVYQIFMSEYRGGTWTHPSSLSDHISASLKDATRPRVAMNDAGDTVIVWEQGAKIDNCTTLLCRNIFKSEYRAGVWSHPTGLADFISINGEDAFDAEVAIDNAGRTVIAWTQTDGSTDCALSSCRQIYLSEYR